MKNLFNNKTAKGLVSFVTIIVLLSSILATSVFYENSITANVIREDLANWQVNILKKKSVVKCKCGYKGRANIKERLHDIILFNCPKCNEIPEVISGDKIIIKSIEIK